MSNLTTEIWAGCARSAKAGPPSSASYETGCTRPSCWNIEMKRQPDRWAHINQGDFAAAEPAQQPAAPKKPSSLSAGSMYSPMLRRVISGDELKSHIAEHLQALRWEFTSIGAAVLHGQPTPAALRMTRRKSLREVTLGFEAIELGEVGLPPGPVS